MAWAPGRSQNGSGYTDELVQVRVNNNLDDPMMSQTMLPLDYPMEMYPGDHWVLQDANYNVLGLVDRDGKMVERYEYSPYGERKVFVSAGNNDAGCYAPTLVSWRRTMYTMVGGMYDNPVSVPDQPFGLCEFGHQGLPHEEEIDNGGMIQNRMRIRRGERWYQRDPLEYPDGMNSYAAYHIFLGGTDPYGLMRGNPPANCRPEECCAQLLSKMALWSAHLTGRLAEWAADKNDIRGLVNPQKYNFEQIKSHLDLIKNAQNQLLNCHNLASIACKSPPPPPEPVSIPAFPSPPKGYKPKTTTGLDTVAGVVATGMSYLPSDTAIETASNTLIAVGTFGLLVASGAMAIEGLAAGGAGLIMVLSH